MVAKEDGVVTNPFAKQTHRTNKVAINPAKTGAQAEFASTIIEL